MLETVSHRLSQKKIRFTRQCPGLMGEDRMFGRCHEGGLGNRSDTPSTPVPSAPLHAPA